MSSSSHASVVKHNIYSCINETDIHKTYTRFNFNLIEYVLVNTLISALHAVTGQLSEHPDLDDQARTSSDHKL